MLLFTILLGAESVMRSMPQLLAWQMQQTEDPYGGRHWTGCEYVWSLSHQSVAPAPYFHHAQLHDSLCETGMPHNARMRPVCVQASVQPLSRR